MSPKSANLQQRFFRSLNSVVEPAVRNGCTTPLVGPGAYLVTTTGRVSGKARSVPLLGLRLGNTVLVSTVRRDSQWIKNLENLPKAQVMMDGKSRIADVRVKRPLGGGIARLRVAA